MKTITLCLFVFLLGNAFAMTEHTPADLVQPDPAEISRNRACFEDLARLGCEDRDDDDKGFRKCLKEVRPSLSEDCRKMMIGLYGKN